MSVRNVGSDSTKQDTATAATDAELAAGLAPKQDSATAATDAELAAAIALQLPLSRVRTARQSFSGQAGSNTTVARTLNFSSAFADNNYTVMAMVEDNAASTDLRIVNVVTRNAGNITVNVTNTGGVARDGVVHVIAIHD